MVLIISVITGIAMYGLHNPPLHETGLSEWLKKTGAGNHTLFQHSSLDVVKILPADMVVLRDRYDMEVVAKASPSLAQHPALQKIQRINAILTKNGDECIVLKSIAGSGKRHLKLIVSWISVFIVFAIFIRHFKFVWSKAVFVPREGRDA